MNKLFKVREELKLTQEQMAKKLNISVSYYRKLENGDRSPSYNFINKFVATFPDIKPAFFFNSNCH